MVHISRNNQTQQVCFTGSIAIGITVLICVCVMLQFGSLSSGLAYLAGDRLLVDSRVKSFGYLQSGADHKTLTFSIRNTSQRPVQIVGARSSCTCLITEELPLTIPAQDIREIAVRVTRTNTRGALEKTIELYTDYNRPSSLVLRVVGHVAG